MPKRKSGMAGTLLTETLEELVSKFETDESGTISYDGMDKNKLVSIGELIGDLQKYYSKWKGQFIDGDDDVSDDYITSDDTSGEESSYSDWQGITKSHEDECPIPNRPTYENITTKKRKLKIKPTKNKKNKK